MNPTLYVNGINVNLVGTTRCRISRHCRRRDQIYMAVFGLRILTSTILCTT